MVCGPYILTMTCRHLEVASASGMPLYRSTATRHQTLQVFEVKPACHIPTFRSQLTNDDGFSTGCAFHQLPPNQPPPSTPPISLDPSLQLYHHTNLIMVLEHISDFTWSWPPSAFPNSRTFGLQDHTIMACKGITRMILCLWICQGWMHYAKDLESKSGCKMANTFDIRLPFSGNWETKSFISKKIY